MWHTKRTRRCRHEIVVQQWSIMTKLNSRRAWLGALIPDSSFVYPLSGADTPIAVRQKWSTWQSGMCTHNNKRESGRRDEITTISVHS